MFTCRAFIILINCLLKYFTGKVARNLQKRNLQKKLLGQDFLLPFIFSFIFPCSQSRRSSAVLVCVLYCLSWCSFLPRTLMGPGAVAGPLRGDQQAERDLSPWLLPFWSQPLSALNGKQLFLSGDLMSHWHALNLH